jgi:type IV pilus assembly protein PilW
MREVTSPQCPSTGLSLVELLVAIAIGVVLSFGAMNLLLHSKQSYLEAEELARLQENGRHALRYLSYELTMAGYLATLLPHTSVNPVIAGSACFDYLMQTATPLEHVDDVLASGERGSAGLDLPADCLLAGRHKQGTDLLVIRRTASLPVVSRGDRLGSVVADSIYLEQAGMYAMHRLLRGAGAASTVRELWEYLPQVLFLRNYSAVRGDAIPTLCRKRPGRSSNRMAPTECLVEGIENLQLEFGIDENGDQLADRFEATPSPAELQEAVAARIYLLVRSVRPLAGYVDSRSYALGNTLVVAPNDGHYRRLMQTTILLRNNGGFKS